MLDKSPRLWVAWGPDQALDLLLPMWEEHRRFGNAILVCDATHNLHQLRRLIGHREADIFVVGNACRDFNRDILLLEGEGGSKHVVGHLEVDPFALKVYGLRSAELLKREAIGRRPVALLSGNESRYCELLDLLECKAEESDCICLLNWSAERIRRKPLLNALRHGLAAALFTGHGTSQGWLAYGGVGHRLLVDGMPWSTNETIATLYSLSCKTGARSFAHELVADGIAGAVLAPTCDILNAHNYQLAQAITKSLGGGANTLSEVIIAAQMAAPLSGYTICGDPGLRPAATHQALLRAKEVFAPAPDSDLLVANARRHEQQTVFSF